MRRRRSNRRGPFWPLKSAQRRLASGPRTVRRVVWLLAVIVLLAVLDRLGFGLYQGGDLSRYDQHWFFVTRVIDGDTLEILQPDGTEPRTRVRLWGIDAPELAKPWQSSDASEPGAEEARFWLTWRCEGQMVKLELLPHRLRGVYGRVLAYVTGRDGVCVNEWLLARGLVRADGRWWHPQRERYEIVEETARRAGIGLWQQPKG